MLVINCLRQHFIVNLILYIEWSYAEVPQSLKHNFWKKGFIVILDFHEYEKNMQILGEVSWYFQISNTSNPISHTHIFSGGHMKTLVHQI